MRPLFYSLVFLSTLNFSLAQSIRLSPQTETLNLCPLVSVYADSTGTLPFDQVRKQSFLPHSEQAFQFGFSSNVFWFRFTIDPGQQLNQNQWYLLWSDGLRDHVDVYVPQANGNWTILKGGMRVPSERKAYKGLFPLYTIGAFQPKTTKTYYLRLEGSEAINGQLTLLTHQAYIDSMPATMAMVWLVIGIQLLRVFYNIILARYVQDNSFRWYVFHTVIVTASVLGSFGVTGTLLGSYPNLASFFNVAFYELMPATYTLFIFSLLSVRVNYPKLRWVFFAIVGCSILQLVLHLFVLRMYLLTANNYLFLFTEAFLIGICIHALVRRVKMNAYLLIPCFITLVPFIFLNLRALGVIQYGWIYPLIYATNFLEIVALALVLGKIIQHAEEQRLTTEKALFTEKVEAEKLVELDTLKTRFFTNISHEFRTPLTLIIGPLNDLRQRFPTEELYQILHRNASRLQSLINQLLDLARLDNGQLRPELQPGNLATDFRLWVGSFDSLARSQQVVLSLSQNLADFPARYDADKLEKIANNLIANALKFTSARGQVRMTVDYQTDQLTLTVSDTGAGIAPEHLPYIFDRFYQVDASQRRGYEGTGVGLALVSELVRLLDGRISVSSTPDVGTTLTVTLLVQPLAEAILPAPPTPLSSQPIQQAKAVQLVAIEPDPAGRPVVLVVEDNDDLRAYIRQILVPHYAVLEAPDGQSGLETALDQLPDLIVCDVMMPRLDGFGLCAALRADLRTSHIPVVMLTALATQSDRLTGLQTGADDYLTKPFDRAELGIRVKNLLQRQDTLRTYLREQLTLTTPTSPAQTDTPPEALPPTEEPFLEQLYAYIDAHLDNPTLDVNQLALEAAMSSRTLNRKLTALLGMTANNLIRAYRMRRATEFLLSGLSPSETAYRVGFDNLSYFSRVFREEHGQTPTEYALGSRLSENQQDLSEN